MKRPNILFLLTDNQRYDGLGCTGHPWCRTPAWDAMAAEGMLFEEVRTTSPVCSPARASLWTGVEPHRAGLRTVIHALADNPHADFDRVEGASGVSMPPLAADLRGAGYQTYLAGKWHVGEGWVDRCFDRAVGCHFHAREYAQWCELKGLPNGFVLDDPIRGKAFRSSRPPLMSVPRVAELDIPDWAEYNRWILDQALSLLPDIQRDTPFFFNLSFYGVHPPFFLPRRILDLYSTEHVQEPENWRPSTSEPRLYKDGYYRREWSDWGEDFAAWKEATAASWGYTTYIDELFQEFLEALRKQGLMDDNTLVAMTSDHGDMMGQHGLWQKFCPYEEAVRVPLIIRWPERLPAGRRISASRSLQDVGNTFLCAAGLKPLGPNLLEDAQVETPENRDTFTQYNQPQNWDTWHPVPAWRTVTRLPWKYTLHGNGEEELYKLTRDSGETHNLANNAGCFEIKRQLRMTLQDWGRRTLDDFPYE